MLKDFDWKHFVSGLGGAIVGFLLQYFEKFGAPQ